MRALVTGATGFIGRRLVGELDRPVILSRRPEEARKILGAAEVHAWNPEESPPPAESFEGVEAIFHLAGDSVASGRWTAAKKARIRRSRVQGTANLVEGLRNLQSRTRVLVSASAVGYYGSRGDEVLEETSAPGSDFLSEVSVAWEAEAGRARELGRGPDARRGEKRDQRCDERGGARACHQPGIHANARPSASPSGDFSRPAPRPGYPLRRTLELASGLPARRAARGRKERLQVPLHLARRSASAVGQRLTEKECRC